MKKTIFAVLAVTVAMPASATLYFEASGSLSTVTSSPSWAQPFEGPPPLSFNVSFNFADPGANDGWVSTFYGATTSATVKGQPLNLTGATSRSFVFANWLTVQALVEDIIFEFSFYNATVPEPGIIPDEQSFYDLHPASVRVFTGYGPNGAKSIYATPTAFTFTVRGISPGAIDIPPEPLPAPEPASWAMMIGGLALAGGLMRRHKASVRFA